MTLPRESTSDTSDEALAVRACAGSVDAFEELVRRFQVPVLKFLLRRFPSRRDAEDILQDTFLKVYQSLHQYKPAYRFRTWVFTIAYRITVSHGRKHALPRTALPAGEVADESPRPADAAEGNETRERLWRTAREFLTTEQYTILWLHYAEDMPAPEIAKIMNRSWVSVKTIMHRARKKLEPHLAAETSQKRNQTLSVSTGDL